MGQILGGQPPGDLPHDLQLPRRQGHDAAKFSLQLLGRQDLHPPSPIQTPGLDDLAVQSLDRRPLDLARSLRGHTPAQLEPGRILIKRDHVLKTMLEGLGATVANVSEPFFAEHGAYHGHSHGDGGRSHGDGGHALLNRK